MSGGYVVVPGLEASLFARLGADDTCSGYPGIPR